MAKFELGKSVEATKVNKRSGIPLTERQTIPFGAIIEDPRDERDCIRFSYLGDIFDVKASEVKGAIKPIGGDDLPPPPKPAPVSTAAAAAPAPAPDPRFLKFETIPSNMTVSRAKVPGGWLVAVGHGVAFVADLGYAWDGSTVKDPAPAEPAAE